MRTYKAVPNEIPKDSWRVLMRREDNTETTIALCPNEEWARRIANALSQMEIES
jgi:hypothetical protein